MYKRIFYALAIPVAGLAAAQTAPQPNPADPEVRVPPLEYRSAFAGYRRYAEPELAPWRAANDEVGRIGGHVGMQRPGAAGKSAPKPPASGEHK
jgi:hypothetical protein